MNYSIRANCKVTIGPSGLEESFTVMGHAMKVEIPGKLPRMDAVCINGTWYEPASEPKDELWEDYSRIKKVAQVKLTGLISMEVPVK